MPLNKYAFQITCIRPNVLLLYSTYNLHLIVHISQKAMNSNYFYQAIAKYVQGAHMPLKCQYMPYMQMSLCADMTQCQYICHI